MFCCTCLASPSHQQLFAGMAKNFWRKAQILSLWSSPQAHHPAFHPPFLTPDYSLPASLTTNPTLTLLSLSGGPATPHGRSRSWALSQAPSLCFIFLHLLVSLPAAFFISFTDDSLRTLYTLCSLQSCPRDALGEADNKQANKQTDMQLYKQG